MKIGICSNVPDHIKTAYEAGFDYVEVNNMALAKQSDEEFEKMAALKNELPNGFMYAANGLVPAEYRLTGPDVDFGLVRDFIEKSFARLNRLGVKMVVFGSSKAKHVPEGFSRETAMEQLIKCTAIFAEVGAKYGMQICIEPLRTEEVNIINTAEDSVELAKAVKLPNVGGHVDYYHLMQNGEKMSKLKVLAKDIIHAHIASPCKRTVVTDDDGADYKQFFDYLRQGGYDATVSFEGGGEKTLEVFTQMCAFLKSL